MSQFKLADDDAPQPTPAAPPQPEAPKPPASTSAPQVPVMPAPPAMPVAPSPPPAASAPRVMPAPPTPSAPSTPAPPRPAPTVPVPAVPRAAPAPPIVSPPIPSPQIPIPKVPSPQTPPVGAPQPNAPAADSPAASTPARAPRVQAAPTPTTSASPAAPPNAAPKTPAAPRTPAIARTPAAPRTPPLPRAGAAPAQNIAPSGAAPLAPRAPSPQVPSPQVAPSPQSPSAQTEIIDDGDQFGSLRATMENLDPIANWVFRIAAFAVAGSLAFILFAVFTKHIGQTEVSVPSSVADGLHRAAGIFQFAILLLALSALWLALDMPYLGLVLIGVGLALNFGSPILLLGHVGKTPLVASLVSTMQSSGIMLAIIGVLKQGYEVVMWALNLPNRMKQKADVGFAQQAEPAQRRAARDATMFSPCWKLPFCRETIRKQCPAFLAGKTCWKFGRGCYCDEEMIGRIIRGESLDVIKAPTRLSEKGKPPCGRCHIYLEHQGFKYKMLSPLAFPGTAVAMFMIWPIYSRLFTAFMTSNIWNLVSVDTTKVAPDAIKTDPTNVTVSTLDPDQVAHFATILIGVLVGFFVFVYVSKFIEWAIYKAKL